MGVAALLHRCVLQHSLVKVKLSPMVYFSPVTPHREGRMQLFSYSTTRKSPESQSKVQWKHQFGRDSQKKKEKKSTTHRLISNWAEKHLSQFFFSVLIHLNFVFSDMRRPHLSHPRLCWTDRPARVDTSEGI